MKGHIITLLDNSLSKRAAINCADSTDFPVQVFEAVTPQRVDTLMFDHGIKWTYPWEQSTMDFKSGLELSPYQTANNYARIACFLSHYLLWKKCHEENEPLLVLEHDAIFNKALNPEPIIESRFDIIGVNDPRGATRKSKDFHDMVQMSNAEIQPVPKIDRITIPQGLAGNSAYIIKPSGAEKMLQLVETYGAWPNDALMCRQLISTLGVTKTYYTRVQGTQSTTSL